MKRREFVVGLGGAVAWPVIARAQQNDRMRRVGLLMATAKDDPMGQAENVTFREGLTEQGWVIGDSIGVEVRWPGGNIELAERFAKELVGLKPDVLVARTTPRLHVGRRAS
jgi:putative tryptophan/tyrosine transport system substrate-binding protein